MHKVTTEHETGVASALTICDHKKSPWPRGIWGVSYGSEFLEWPGVTINHTLQVNMCACSFMIQGVMCGVCRQVLLKI